MRLQLIGAAALAALALAPSRAAADDKVDTTITLFQERRVDAEPLQIVHPQVDLGIDLGDVLSLSGGYEADIVSGATEAVYQAAPPGVDAVSSATTFSDTRQVGKGFLSFTGRRSRLTVGYVYGTERDYRSHSVTVGGTVDLPGKNTTFGASYTHNFDQICDYDNGDATPLERRALSGEDACFVAADDPMRTTISKDVAIDTTEATVTQNLSPTVVMQLGLHGQIIRGFQSNPYRRVRVAGVDAQEAVPDVRARLAVYLRTNIAFPTLHSALAFSLRGYHDTWDVMSLAGEIGWHQYLGEHLLFRVRGRVYQQSAAAFFQDAIDYENFGAVGAYFTGDRELGPMRNVLIGGKLSLLDASDDSGPVWGLFDELDFHLRADGMWAESLTDTAPGGDPSGPLPDFVVVSLGLLLRY